jgi:hypothetical protein
MSMSRGDLIEYLCSQQHAAWLTAKMAAGASVNGGPFATLPLPEKRARREAMAVVLDELESLGMLREKTPAT